MGDDDQKNDIGICSSLIKQSKLFSYTLNKKLSTSAAHSGVSEGKKTSQKEVQVYINGSILIHIFDAPTSKCQDLMTNCVQNSVHLIFSHKRVPASPSDSFDGHKQSRMLFISTWYGTKYRQVKTCHQGMMVRVAEKSCGNYKWLPIYRASKKVKALEFICWLPVVVL